MRRPTRSYGHGGGSNAAAAKPPTRFFIEGLAYVPVPMIVGPLNTLLEGKLAQVKERRAAKHQAQ